MLIFTSKSPGWGKQKPQQWGPLSSVRSAVFRNAEAMGIDPSNLLGLWPLWEGCGPARNIVDGSPDDLLGEAAWANTGVLFNSTSGTKITTSVDLTKVTTQMTLISHFDSQATSYNFWFGASSGDNNLVKLYRASDTSVSFIVYVDGGAKTFTADAPFLHDGEVHSIAATLNLDSNVRRTFYDGNLGDFELSDIGNALSAADGSVLVLGGRYDTFYGFNGTQYIDTFFNVDLLDTQIDRLHGAPYALLQPNPTPLIFDWGSGGGSTLSIATSWKLFNASQRSTAWRTLAAATSNTAWRVFNTLDKPTAWKTFNATDKDLAWRAFNSTSADTAWKMFLRTEKATAWKTFNATEAGTAWMIYNTAARDTAWKILNAGSAAMETAWRIYNTANKATAWSIQTQAELETAWKIINSGSTAISTAWKIYNAEPTDTAWKTFAKKTASTAWNIFNVSESSTAWRIKAQIQRETGWQIFNSADLSTAWALNSELIPEPVKIFLAESRTVAFKAASRTIIFFE